MDALISQVNGLKISLDTSRSTLKLCNRKAEAEVGTELKAMQDVLMSMNKRIDNGKGEVDILMRELNEPNASATLDLQPMMRSLSDKVTTVLADLNTVEKKTMNAIQLSMKYHGEVRDINQEIAVQQRDMERRHEESTRLQSAADSSLSDTKRQLENARAELAEANEGIKYHEGKIKDLQSDLSTSKSALDSVSNTLSTAAYQARRSKKRAFIGAGTAVLGVALVPFTFGASGALVGAGAVYGAAHTGNYQDLKSKQSSLRTTYWRLTGEISDTEKKLQNLRSDKASKELRLSRLECELMSFQSAKKKSEHEIGNALEVQVDLAELNYRAQAMIEEAEELESGLQTLKHTLTECAKTLSEESAQLKPATVPRPIARRADKRREFIRNKEAVKRVVHALSTTQQTVPSLLSRTEMRYLGAAP